MMFRVELKRFYEIGGRKGPYFRFLPGRELFDVFRPFE